ncbi:hypothetical protein ABZP36_010838 [Zizania latifolia]
MSSTAACSPSQLVSSGDIIIIDDIPEPPPSKRKLNFDNEPGACDVLPPMLISLAGVAKAKELLLQLITISQHLQLAHAEFKSYSAQKKTELDEAQCELESHIAASKNQDQEKILVREKREAKEKLIAFLTAQLHEATTALKAIQEEEEQLAHTSSKHEADGKKWNETIAEATTGVEQAASNL